METSTRSMNDVSIVSASGRIDTLTYELLLNALNDLIRGGARSLVVDLGSVGYTSSAGLRAILSAQKDVRRQGGDLRLAAVQPDVLRVLKLSGFTSIFKIYETVEAAVASFASEG
jgi:anti-sigma B factor antagonist